jgi:putative transposase
MDSERSSFPRHRSPAEIISHAVWLYYVFSLLQGLRYKPRRLITYGVAQRAVLPDVRHRTSRYLNNRAENSHRPTRRRERQMQRFKSPGQAQRFLSMHAMVYGHFRPRRHLMAAAGYRRARAKAFRVWRQETCGHRSS